MESNRSSGSAALTALSIAELLTLILRHVDVRTLLFAQRVNRTFRAVISGSLVLQRKLFFQPRLLQRAAIDEMTASEKENTAQLVTYDDESRHEPRYVRHVRLNPLLVRSFPNFFPKSDVGGRREDFTRLDWGRNAERAAAYAWPAASWRRMLLSDPVPANAELAWTTSYMRGHDTYRVDLQQDGQEGVRMGLLYDLVQELVIEKGRHHNGRFAVSWPLAKPYTETEQLRERVDWEHRIVAIEGEQFDLEVGVNHVHSCVDHYDDYIYLPGSDVVLPVYHERDMAIFRSEASDVANIDSVEKEHMVYGIGSLI
ncbi:hypothetical protein MFIFM68171_04789 [Madurella fahalii]|uniref:F-box domain-containing protein n=1 Tax=Madurella fahalii TaxID=1157608 RepID=A0ABQ0GA84_9PEZI